MRHPHEPTEKDRHMVKAMSAVGVAHERIALVIGIDDKTLRKHYREDLDQGAVEAETKVKQTLFRLATGKWDDKKERFIRQPDPATAKFLATVRWGWKEQVDLNVTGDEALANLVADLNDLARRRARDAAPAGAVAEEREGQTTH